MTTLADVTWDAARLNEALETLARQANLVARATPALKTNPGRAALLAATGDDTRAHWVEQAARHLGIEAEPVVAPHSQVVLFIERAAPALIAIHHAEIQGYLVMLTSGRTVTLIAPDLTRRKISAAALRDALCAEIETSYIQPLDEVLANVRVPEQRRAQVRQTVLAQQLSTTPIVQGWLLRLAPRGVTWAQLASVGAPMLFAAIIALALVQQGVSIVNWGVIGRGALQGSFEWAWLWAWALVMVMGVPLQMLSSVVGARLSVVVSGLFKNTLLFGMLQLRPEEIRHQGIGQFLNRVMDAGVVESGSLSGVLTIVFSMIQVLTALGVLSLGVGGWVSMGLLALIAFAIGILGWQMWRSNETWVDTYRGMTNHLVEQMVGYRTRLAQQDAALWHTDEDAELAQYVSASEHAARMSNWLAALPRVWMIAGLVSILPVIIWQTVAPTTIALSLGGILLAEQALNVIVANIHNLISFAKAWQQIKPLFDAARRATDPGLMLNDLSATKPPNEDGPTQNNSALVTLREVAFRYRERGRLALRDASLEIFDGDRVMIQGGSGGGKSTLAAVVAGLRVPESGLLLLRGYDRASVGLDEWRKRVVVAPQFHENHVFTETFAFNLLMGRHWPPSEEDTAEAIQVCEELGLGELIARMPSGLSQIVGESGWQLSHGEQSRLFIARALLQRADLIILDESFAALDPENLERALRCVLNRAASLVVIAHP